MIVRTSAETTETLAHNLFAESPGNHVMTLFTDDPLPANSFDGATQIRNEQMRLANPPSRAPSYGFYPATPRPEAALSSTAAPMRKSADCFAYVEPVDA